jgi:hypothetical protein
VKAELGPGQLRRCRASSETERANVVSRLSNSAQHLYLGGEIIVGSRDSLLIIQALDNCDEMIRIDPAR